MENKPVRLDQKALARFDKALALASALIEEGEHRPAEWFDTPEKRLQWWLDLEPQWRKAFLEAVFQLRKLPNYENYQPTDKELAFLFGLRQLNVCGSGDFRNRNNPPDISFQLTNLTGVRNLTGLRRIECDFNGLIESLEPLRHLVNLEVLWCDNNRISSLEPLMGLGKLRGLCCWNNHITNLEPLAGLILLNDLTLGLYDEGNPLENVEPLRHLANLRTLNLNACGLRSLAPLEKLENLKWLEAPYNNLDTIPLFEGKDIYIEV